MPPAPGPLRLPDRTPVFDPEGTRGESRSQTAQGQVYIASALFAGTYGKTSVTSASTAGTYAIHIATTPGPRQYLAGTTPWQQGACKQGPGQKEG